MSLLNYMNETELTNMLKNDCADFMNKFGAKPSMFSGTYTPMKHSGYQKLTTLDNSKPEGTNHKYFPMINEWLQNNNHMPSNKNMVFGSGNKTSTKNWKYVYALYPMGNMEFSFMQGYDFNMYKKSSGPWNDSALTWTLKEQMLKQNMYAMLMDNMYTMNDTLNFINNPKNINKKIKVSGMMDDDYQSKTMNEWNNLQTQLNNWMHTNKNTHLMKNKGWEIWFKCKEYYLVELNSKLHF